MTYAIMMTCINVAEFVLISSLEKDHSMIETRRLKNFYLNSFKFCAVKKNLKLLLVLSSLIF